MPLPMYLAMTAAEISGCGGLPAPIAYMACHFSAYTTGLSNYPAQLPKGSMLILNDRIPVCGHDPIRVAEQLNRLCNELEAESLLLDLQRPNDADTHKIVQAVLQSALCPVGVSDCYADGLDCPVFLSTPPLHLTLQQHIAKWAGREIWLEAALERCTYTVTEAGSHISATAARSAPLPCPQLHCHYGIYEHTDSIDFSVERTWDDLQDLLKEANASGISRAIGLYQQLSKGIL